VGDADEIGSIRYAYCTKITKVLYISDTLTSIMNAENLSYYQAIDYFNEGELEKAERIFLEILPKHKSDPNIFRWLGKIYMEKEDFESAKTNFEKALENSYKDDQGKVYDTKFKNFSLLMPEKKNVDEDALAWTYHDLGYICIAHRDCRFKAKANLEAAIEQMEASKKYIPWFINDLGLFYYEIGKYQEAIKQYDSVIKKDKNKVSKDKNGYAQLFCGLAKYRSGDKENARNSLNEAQEIFNAKNEDLEAQKVKQFDKSDRQMKKKEIFSNELIIADIQANIARIDIDEKRYENAEILLYQAAEKYKKLRSFIKNLTPIKKSKEKENLAAIYINLGIVYYNQDLIEKSRKLFVKALGCSQSAQAYYNLGNVFSKGKNTDRAENLYRSALEIDPELKEAREALKNLKKIEEKKIDWWDWWFNNENSAKPMFGVILMVTLLAFSLSLALPYTEETTITTTINNSLQIQNETKIENNGSTTILWINNTSLVPQKIDQTKVENYTNQTSKTYPTNIATTIITHPQKIVTTKSSGLSQEYKLIIIALIILLLLHPRIKGFSAGPVKFDFEPIAVSKGAAPPK
jgi:tetratricopeptide (TPR) repeat protein